MFKDTSFPKETKRKEKSNHQEAENQRQRPATTRYRRTPDKLKPKKAQKLKNQEPENRKLILYDAKSPLNPKI